MTDLLDRLRAAGEGSRELDAEIFCAVHPGYSIYLAEDGTWECMKAGEYGPLVSPHYTTSLDAAKSLAPAGCSWGVGDCGEDDGPWACVTNAATIDFSSSAATPELSLCIAALLARSSPMAAA